MSEPGYESSGCKRSVGTKRLDTPCTPIRKSKRFSAFAVFSFVLIWHDFFSFLCLFVFHVSFFFLVHTSPILPFQKNVTKAREKQVNKRKTGNEYEKFSLLYVNMVRFKKKKATSSSVHSDLVHSRYIPRANFSLLSCSASVRIPLRRACTHSRVCVAKALRFYRRQVQHLFPLPTSAT